MPCMTCWLRKLGIKINGLIVDTMIASSLIDENRYSYTLNTLSWHHLNKGKNESKLIKAAKERLDQKQICGDYHLWKLVRMRKRYGVTLELWGKVKI